MYLLDVIGPGDPGFKPYVEPNYITPVIIIGAIVVVVAIFLIVAVNIKKEGKK